MLNFNSDNHHTILYLPWKIVWRFISNGPTEGTLFITIENVLSSNIYRIVNYKLLIDTKVNFKTSEYIAIKLSCIFTDAKLFLFKSWFKINRNSLHIIDGNHFS